MENASKALIIAGGILLAMMILALMVYVGTSMTDMAESEDRRTLAEQTEEFNKSYLSYNKSRMYGTDVITVVNKAIEHNKNIATSTDDPYYINVIVKTTEDFKTTGIVIDSSYSSDDKRYEQDMTQEEINQKTEKSSTTFTMNANSSDGYSLGHWNSDETELMMNKGIVEFFEQSKVDEIKKEGRKTYYIYSALTNFKRAIFKCEKVEYNKSTGRIDEMVFTQIEI